MFSNKFIMATKEYNTFKNTVPAPYIRKDISLEKEIEIANLTICGSGFYKLYVNGKDITKGLLAPYIYNPDQILYYDTYDVKDLLVTGNNALGFILGNGMHNCNGGAWWSMDIAKHRSAPIVAFALEIKFSDGTEEIIEADETFKTHPSPILFDDLRCGEFYDARQEIDGWNLAGFDDSSWKKVISVRAPGGDAVICDADPIVTYLERKAVKITKAPYPKDEYVAPKMPVIEPSAEEKADGYVYDFGYNNAGNIKIKIKGKAGQQINLRFAERLDDNGSVFMDAFHFQPRYFNHVVRYTLKGDGVEEYTPSFTYQGFRYCFINGITEEQATEELLTYKVMSSNLEENGAFSCSNELINKLQAATLASDRSNFYYFLTDCPHREKNGWTADAALSAEQVLFNFKAEKSLKEWMRSLRHAQRRDGAVPCIVPTNGWGFEWGNGPAWDSALFFVPYYVWLYRGDTQIIKENSAAMVKYFDFLSKKRDENGLLHYGLGDWCQIKRDSYKAPLIVTDTLITLHMCEMASRMFEAAGLKIQKSMADAFYTEIRAAARKHLIEADGCTVLGRCQTSQVLAIAYNLFDECEKKAAFDRLLHYIHKENDFMDVGVLGAREIFHVLSSYGYTELALKMIIRPEYPSYANWILEDDATTLFEYYHKPNNASLNHHFWGDISSWFVKNIAGIKVNPNLDNPNEVEISPYFVNDMQHAEGYINIPAGKVECSWQREENGDITLNVTVPNGATGYIRMPENYGIVVGKEPSQFAFLASGTYKITSF